jgi:hypothetical protein
MLGVLCWRCFNSMQLSPFQRQTRLQEQRHDAPSNGMADIFYSSSEDQSFLHIHTSNLCARWNIGYTTYIIYIDNVHT